MEDLSMRSSLLMVALIAIAGFTGNPAHAQTKADPAAPMIQKLERIDSKAVDGKIKFVATYDKDVTAADLAPAISASRDITLQTRKVNGVSVGVLDGKKVTLSVSAPPMKPAVYYFLKSVELQKCGKDDTLYLVKFAGKTDDKEALKTGAEMAARLAFAERVVKLGKGKAGNVAVAEAEWSKMDDGLRVRVTYKKVDLKDVAEPDMIEVKIK
jgi:hypothetical protein